MLLLIYYVSRKLTYNFKVINSLFIFKLNFFYYNSQPDHSQLLEDTTIITNEATIGESMEETAGESQQLLQE